MFSVSPGKLVADGLGHLDNWPIIFVVSPGQLGANIVGSPVGRRGEEHDSLIKENYLQFY
jgi:hypothetical protein